MSKDSKFLPEGVEEVLEPHEMPYSAQMKLENTPPEHGADSKWRQRGTSLDCTSCNMPHGIYLPPSMIFTGEVNEEGMPIVKDRY